MTPEKLCKMAKFFENDNKSKAMDFGLSEAKPNDLKLLLGFWTPSINPCQRN
jgi:hypothetical protein